VRCGQLQYNGGCVREPRSQRRDLHPADEDLSRDPDLGHPECGVEWAGLRLKSWLPPFTFDETFGVRRPRARREAVSGGCAPRAGDASALAPSVIVNT